ncbi:hypothetical protein E2C01_088776 [Portunus trituberculatus]|uniref:Uncharacterized protein n=1 Tax=Portunus trituberculatus TaxID=210409 RepID=A0A5B7JFL7_PORTR|nr:hypothetical protein [Portunus trituberculatus]
MKEWGRRGRLHLLFTSFRGDEGDKAGKAVFRETVEWARRASPLRSRETQLAFNNLYKRFLHSSLYTILLHHRL